MDPSSRTRDWLPSVLILRSLWHTHRLETIINIQLLPWLSLTSRTSEWFSENAVHNAKIIKHQQNPRLGEKVKMQVVKMKIMQYARLLLTDFYTIHRKVHYSLFVCLLYYTVVYRPTVLCLVCLVMFYLVV